MITSSSGRIIISIHLTNFILDLCPNFVRTHIMAQFGKAMNRAPWSIKWKFVLCDL